MNRAVLFSDTGRWLLQWTSIWCGVGALAELGHHPTVAGVCLAAALTAGVAATVNDDRGELMPRRKPVDLDDIVGIQEIAEMAGVKQQRTGGTVNVWRQRGILPEPAKLVSGNPIWLRPTIQAWLEETGRAPKEEAS